MIHLEIVNTDELFRAALVHLDAGRLNEAARAMEQVLAVDPAHADTLHELGLLLHQAKQDQRAVELLSRAADLRPDDYRFQYNAGAVLRLMGRSAEPIEFFRRAVSLRGADADTFNVLGECLRESDRLTEAAAVFRRAIELRPDFAVAYNNLGRALQDQCETDAAMESYRAALAIQPRYPGAHSNLLLCLNYSERVTPSEIFAEHQAFGRLYSAVAPVRLPPHPRSTDGRIRIGYLSPDFRQHSVAFFIWPILKGHDRSKFHITCYADVSQPDILTDQMRSLCDRWRKTSDVTDDQLAGLVAEDQIDILVELAGHTASNRLPLLARRIAPIQVTYLGYPNTTGLANVDYRITDSIADPPGLSDELHTEQLVRLPGAFFSYIGLTGVPEVGLLPASQVGHVTFAVFCNFAKVQPAMVRRWANVLLAVPRSRLLVQAKGLSDEPTRQALARMFAEAGITPDRLDLRGWVDFPVYVQRFNRVDIMLDTLPFCGHTTTCHALWMGEPVITLAGQTHRSRMGASILTHLGMPELIATNDEEFVRLASELAGDLPRLALLRASLRERTRQTLCDADRFTRGLESVYTDMYHGHL